MPSGTRGAALIDLHCHLLPGIDDGAPDLETALRMARIAHDDGIRTIACTPHIYPGLYDNDADAIRGAIATLQVALADAGIDLVLVPGADTHLVPEVLDGVRRGRIPTLNGSRYLLLEPPHHVEPPNFLDSLFQLRAGGIVPVITHPERLSWVEERHATFVRAVEGGALLQITAGSLTGRFGRRARYWAQRFLDEGLVSIIATDAHGASRRPPLLAEARDAAAQQVGADEARRLVEERPAAIIADHDPATLPVAYVPAKPAATTWWRRLVPSSNTRRG